MKFPLLFTTLLAFFASLTTPLRAQTLVHYWNFNDNSSLSTLLTPNTAIVSGGAISAIVGGISTIDAAGGTGQNFNIDNLNARNGDASGTHLRFNDPIGGQLQFDLPTSGFQVVVVRFATRRSGSGAGTQLWSYSTDGSNYLFFDSIFPNNGNPTLQTLDFSTIPLVNNNPNFKLRVAFEQGSGGTVGNNRFDNFTLDAVPQGGDIFPPTVAFNPINNSINVPINTNPTLSFNEPIRLINDSAINNGNVGSVLELRLNDSTGVLVAFTATISGSMITVDPIDSLLNNQTYYLGVVPNTIEDTSNNAITSRQFVQFTTITPQTQFSQGDLVVVGIRTNATGSDDQIALLTLIDMLPGTLINITDTKVTTNTPPQCPGGLVWTSPSSTCIPRGTVIIISTDAGTASLGTLSGSTFGLSSGGEQVIIYRGTPANPDYITAISTNAWATANTNCGGSNSLIPPGLIDGQSSINLSTAPGNVGGIGVNAYYNGTQIGTPTQLRASILNPANWIAVGAGTPPQVWPDYSFPGPPRVLSASVASANSIRLVFNTNLQAGSALNLSNYTGISGLVNVTLSNNGSLADTVILNYATAFAPSINYVLQVDSVRNTDNIPMLCPFTFSFSFNTSVQLGSNFLVAQENSGTINISLNISSPAAASVDLVYLPSPWSTASLADFSLANTTINISGAATTQNIALQVVDDTLAEQHAEYAVFALRNPVGCAITGDSLLTVYIRDNDRLAPTPNQDIVLQLVNSFDPSGASASTCEVVVYDSATRKLITNSSVSNRLEIIDFSNPLLPVLDTSISMNPYGGLTGVAVKNSIIAVASPNVDEQQNGTVVFFNTSGQFLKQVTVGALPDNVSFTPDGTKVLTANEGQPNNAYTIDPEGSVSIIDMTPGVANITQANVKTLLFTAFNAQESSIIASGVRKTKSTSTLSQDLEPEFITVSSNSQKAWVSCQENNAIVEIDLTTDSVTGIWALGTKNVSTPGNGYDASDNNGQILIANWPIKSYLIPDAIANYTVGGITYLVTANEGDEKEYAGLNERTTVGAASYLLDTLVFPNASMLKKEHNLGRMRVTNLNGDSNNDGRFEEIFTVGSRSFSIFNANTRALIYDSGDDMEMITSQAPFSAVFNADHQSNTPKGRSRAKGPEPEGVALGTLSGKTFAFVALERVGGVMVYDITDPTDVKFVDYKNGRSLLSVSGDRGPETLIFIPALQSPDNKPYLVVANEISGTLSIFEVINNIVGGIDDNTTHTEIGLRVYPNPASMDFVQLNKTCSGVVLDALGKHCLSFENSLRIDISILKDGVYIIRSIDGEVAKLVVRK